MTSGYSGTPLAKKLGIKEGNIILLANQPESYLSLFAYLPKVSELQEQDHQINFIHLFTFTAQEPEKQFMYVKNDWPRVECFGSLGLNSLKTIY